MDIGLVLPTLGRGAGPAGLDTAAETADELGWSSVWVTDHMLVGRGDEVDEYGWILEALTSLAWVGARHPTLRLGTSAVVPAMRDAPQLAKELATIDVLTEGRLTVAVGVGERQDAPEWANLGKSDRMAVRGAYVDETIALWRHLWGGSVDPFIGQFHRLESFVFEPLPPQGAQLPIWTGGRSDRAVTRAATLADGYHASQTGPEDLRARLPALVERSRAAGRPRPRLSIRTRVRFDQAAGSVYSLHGSSREMAADLEAFAALGVDELIVVFRATLPQDLAAEMRRFDLEVVQRWREAAREAQNALREEYSM
jgi:alkanesulfonate monooxygenase SsuD/methylene tetrahydromethanopterin reductase-like flavin-dependent oxidoreductase (luciferase family)